MKKIIMVSMCLIVATCGCGGKPKKTLQGTDFFGSDYDLEFPDDWEVVTDEEKMNEDIVALSPYEGPDDIFREQVSVGLENFPEDVSEQRYVEMCLEYLVMSNRLPEDTQFEKTRIGTEDAYHLRYSRIEPAGEETEIETDNDVYIVVDGQAAYIITCNYEKGKRDTFQSTVDTIINTFELD